MLDQELNNLVVLLMISQKKTTYKSCTNELACRSGFQVGLNFRKKNLKWDQKKSNWGGTFKGDILS